MWFHPVAPLTVWQEEAHEEKQKYKEGTFILELAKTHREA